MKKAKPVENKYLEAVKKLLERFPNLAKDPKKEPKKPANSTEKPQRAPEKPADN